MNTLLNNRLGLCFCLYAITNLTLIISPLLGQEISIEFVETPISYPVGQLGDGFERTGALKNFTSGLDRDSIRKIIRKELLKYPKGVLENKARLRRIILSDTIILITDDNNEFTKSALGTYIVPATEGNIVLLDASQILLPAVLHHEISSVFLYELATTDRLFRKKTDQMLQRFYLKTPYYVKDENINNNIEINNNWPSLENNYFSLCNNGYALVDAENDFNEIVKCLFIPKLLKSQNALLVDPTLKLWQFLEEAKASNYEVYTKVMMVIDYYHAIHPSFTEEYFRALENK